MTAERQQVTELLDGISPFQKNIVLGYYDGPTEAFSGILNEVFYLKLVAWDEGQDRRCYAVEKLEEVDFADLERTFAEYFGKPVYPDWVIRRNISDTAAEAKLDRFISDSREGSTGIQWLMLGEGIAGSVKFRSVTVESLPLIRQQLLTGHVGNLSSWLKYFDN